MGVGSRTGTGSPPNRSRGIRRSATIACDGYSKNRVIKRRTTWLVNASGKLKVFNVTTSTIGYEHNPNDVEHDDEEEDGVLELCMAKRFTTMTTKTKDTRSKHDGKHMETIHMKHLQLKDVVQAVERDGQVVVEYVHMYPHRTDKQGDKEMAM